MTSTKPTTPPAPREAEPDTEIWIPEPAPKPAPRETPEGLDL